MLSRMVKHILHNINSISLSGSVSYMSHSHSKLCLLIQLTVYFCIIRPGLISVIGLLCRVRSGWKQLSVYKDAVNSGFENLSDHVQIDVCVQCASVQQSLSLIALFKLHFPVYQFDESLLFFTGSQICFLRQTWQNCYCWGGTSEPILTLLKGKE